MSNEKGVVLNIREDGWAEVITEGKEACAGCKASHCCVSFGQANKVVTQAVNVAKAEVGDLVTLTLQTGQVIKSATTVYLIPIGGLVLGAFLGAYWHNSIGISESGGAVLFGLGGVALGYLVALLISNSMASRGKLTPVITSVIKKGAGLGRTLHGEEPESNARAR